MNVKGRSFAIIGAAVSGIAAGRKLKELGAEVFISEYNALASNREYAKLEQEFDCEFGGHTDKVLNCETLVVSPGVPQTIPIIEQAKESGKDVISEIELGYRLKFGDSKIICCTGSNGKSTTVSLINHILNQCGYKTVLAGNIGVPFTSYEIEKPGIDFIILELSSFQLELIDTFKADVAILLNITPDHLDRYRSFEHYALTKLNIFNNQDENCLAVINNDDPVIKDLMIDMVAPKCGFSMVKAADCYLQDKSIVCSGIPFEIDDFSLKGPHNIMNIMAVLLAIRSYTRGFDQLVKEALASFPALTHRMEFVDNINGIIFVNDSKATNTDAVKYALQSYSGRVHLILGGSDKGEDFSVLLPYLQNPKVKVYLIGATRGRMCEAFAGKLDFEEYENLELAVKAAYGKAQSGDTILLSPACASYDAFKNFVHRGNSFKDIVRSIANEEIVK